MRAVVQRCLSARVEVAGEIVGAIEGLGLVAFVAAGRGDTEVDRQYLVEKIIGARVFEDERGKMGCALADVKGSLLVVSQFTLYGDMRRGRRPDFTEAMAPAEAAAALDAFLMDVRARGIPVATGRFGADMRVFVENDGPVTLLFDSKRLF
jgi:D-tyrosyl-tRNA(Tyr) deacylase